MNIHRCRHICRIYNEDGIVPPPKSCAEALMPSVTVCEMGPVKMKFRVNEVSEWDPN